MTAASFENNKIIGSLLAGAAVEFARFVTVVGAEDVQHTAAGGRIDGVSYLACLSGQPLSMVTDGIVVLEAGGTVSDGDPLISGADGRAVVSTDPNCYAVALEDATVGAHFRALLMPKNAIAAGPEILVNTPGAISLATYATFLDSDATDAHTLADGLYDGQQKLIRQRAGTNTPVAVITGAFNDDGTSANTLTLNATGEGVLLVWSEDEGEWLAAMKFGTSPTFSTV